VFAAPVGGAGRTPAVEGKSPSALVYTPTRNGGVQSEKIKIKKKLFLSNQILIVALFLDYRLSLPKL
jgi:hypothetical protein